MLGLFLKYKYGWKRLEFNRRKQLSHRKYDDCAE